MDRLSSGILPSRARAVATVSHAVSQALTGGVPAFAAGELRFSGALATLAGADAFAERLGALRRVEWVVYAKRPFAGPAQVLSYLGRYTHRVAIANSRLVPSMTAPR